MEESNFCGWSATGSPGVVGSRDEFNSALQKGQNVLSELTDSKHRGH
jgi:hypothetical protein